MQAIVVDEYGGPEVLKRRELPDPVPGPNEVVVRLRAIGVNPVETYLRAGAQGYTPALPFTPGADGAGEIDAVGEAVTGLAVKDRVYTAGSITGTYAEKCLCSVDQVHPLPVELTFDQGAALWINYGTAFRALFQRGGGLPGERVLIHGATGGVGVASVQWATYRRLQVVGTYGSSAGENLLQDLGVERRYDHHDSRHSGTILNSEGKIDLIVEMLANINLAEDLALLADGGRIAVVGSRGEVTIAPRDLMSREGDVRGVKLAMATPQDLQEIHEQIAAAVQAGAIRPIIQERMPLVDAPRAHAMVIDGPSHGKIVLQP